MFDNAPDRLVRFFSKSTAVVPQGAFAGDDDEPETTDRDTMMTNAKKAFRRKKPAGVRIAAYVNQVLKDAGHDKLTGAERKAMAN